MGPAGAGEAQWWRGDLPERARAPDTPPQGLTTAQARERLARDGPNLLPSPARTPLLARVGRRVRNPLVLVLLAAGGVAVLTGESASAWIIAAVVVLSLALDHWQEQHAERAAARLGEQIALRARVVRDGREQRVPVAGLVAGDVVLLGAGAQVPADGLLLAAQDLFVQQAVLTGEPFPVEKRPARPAGRRDDEEDILFMGTSVLSGSGTLQVCRTGAATRLGGMAQLVGAERGDSAFDDDLRRFGAFILATAMFLVLFVLLAGGIAQRPWLETFLFAVALAVGITPELLPMVVTISLARGALRLAQRGVIVRRQSAIHDLGALDVLCTDKTGTLTESRIELVRHVDIDGRDSPQVMENAFLNSHFESGLRTPLEEAILRHGGVNSRGWRKIDEVPFDFERRRVSVLVEGAGERRLALKGAAPDVLAHCDRWQDAGAARPWTPAARQRARNRLRALESDGMRVLGVAYKVVPSTLQDATLQDENAMVFAGFAAFLDPPKADAVPALRALVARGVAVKVLTGDSDLVARHVWQSLGMPVQGVLLGSEAAALDDRALARRIRHANLFCRVDPVQKDRIIRALRMRGHVVGYLGDGVNDAPALHSANVGISVDGAADAARAAADLVLLRHDLGVLATAVTEGRRTFVNTRKYILLGTSSNFGNMASMAAAAVFLPFLPMLPVQILLNNLLYDTASAALPLDRVDPDELAAPQQWDMALVRRFMFVIGPVSSLFDLLTFALLQFVLGAAPGQFQSAWFLESLATQVLAMFVIRTRGPAVLGRPHPVLPATAAAVLGVAVLLPFTSLGVLFGLVALPARYYFALGGMVLAYLVVLELSKRLFYRAVGAAGAGRPPT